MPVVMIPKCFLDLADASPDEAECRVYGRTESEIIQELWQRFPAMFTRFKDTAGQYHTKWFNLFRELGGEDLRFTPDLVLGDDERLYLINAIGC